jgi:aldehyde dehydrogenase
MSLEILKNLGVKIAYKAHYDNFIGGKWVAPVKGEYFDVISPITGKPYTKAARSSAEDVELALDAAHKAADAWGKASTTERANVLLKIADRIEQNLELQPLKQLTMVNQFVKP